MKGGKAVQTLASRPKREPGEKRGTKELKRTSNRKAGGPSQGVSKPSGVARERRVTVKTDESRGKSVEIIEGSNGAVRTREVIPHRR